MGDGGVAAAPFTAGLVHMEVHRCAMVADVLEVETMVLVGGTTFLIVNGGPTSVSGASSWTIASGATNATCGQILLGRESVSVPARTAS